MRVERNVYHPDHQRPLKAFSSRKIEIGAILFLQQSVPLWSPSPLMGGWKAAPSVSPTHPPSHEFIRLERPLSLSPSPSMFPCRRPCSPPQRPAAAARFRCSVSRKQPYLQVPCEP